MSSLSLKESILESFAQFFQKIASNHPLKEELLQNLSSFQQIILSDNSNYLQTKIFISSLYQKNIAPTISKPSQGSLADFANYLPSDLSLKEFTPEKLRSPFSLLTKFTYAPFKDYLSKNLISLPIDSPLMYKYSHIREFLPDSQNFYRVIGLSLLEAFLSDISLISRLNEWYNKVFYRDVTLSSHIYSFSSEDLRSTFCGYLKQLIQTRVDNEETKEGQKSRNLLFNMDCKDSIFDIALISFIKEMLIQKLDISKSSPENIEGRIKANDSTLIEDLIGEISQAFNVNLIVQIVQNKNVNETIYAVQTSDPRAFPTLHILNEKQLSYQNFSILNIDNFENEIFKNEKQVSSHTRNASLQHAQPSVNPKLEKAFSTDAKGPLEKSHKNNNPFQILMKRGSLPEGTSYGLGSISDKVTDMTKTNLIKQFSDGNGYKSDEEVVKINLVDEISPNKDVLSLSKILNGLGSKSKPSQEENLSPLNFTTAIQNTQNLDTDDFVKAKENFNQPGTPPKLLHQLSKESDSSKSPRNFHVSPLTLNLLPATQLQEQSMKDKNSFNQNEQLSINPSQQIQSFNENISISEPHKSKNNSDTNSPKVLQARDNNRPFMTNNLPSKDINENIKFNLEKNMLQELQKPKIVTMIPKFMSSVPYNPFSMGPSNPMNGFATNGFQSQDQNVRESRQNIKLNPRLDIEDHSGYAHRRFSLNPLTSQGNNSEYLNKKPGMTENSGKHLRSSGQKHNENYSNRYE